jgi:hypothetical protein
MVLPACCFELVAAAYRMGLLSFPAIPCKLGLKPFDLSQMIGPFVKAVPSLPRLVTKRLCSFVLLSIYHSGSWRVCSFALLSVYHSGS